MKRYICKKLENTLNFLPNKIGFCCSHVEGPFFEYSDQNSINISSIKKCRNSYIKQLKSGIIPKECRGCIEFEEIHNNNIFDFFLSNSGRFLIKKIIVNHFKQCNCKCIYCAQKKIWGDEIGTNYELLPIIKELYKKNAIDKHNLEVEFQGGDVSVLKEFEQLFKEFINGGCRKFVILTNGIKYLPEISENSNNAEINMIISLDSGTRETFEKIKQVNAFDSVLDNIKEYAKNNVYVDLKYILIKDINDNPSEIFSFLNVVKELVCVRSIIFDIDYRDMLFGNQDEYCAPTHYKDLISQVSSFCEQNHIYSSVNPYAAKYIN